MDHKLTLTDRNQGNQAVIAFIYTLPILALIRTVVVVAQAAGGLGSNQICLEREVARHRVVFYGVR